MTPASVAHFMASLFQSLNGDIRLLDPGAGVGSLTSALVDRLLKTQPWPDSIDACAYEADTQLMPYLVETLDDYAQVCQAHRIKFEHSVRNLDFILYAADLLYEQDTLFGVPLAGFTHCIMNPPYRKIHSTSVWRRSLQKVGIETSNLYTGFMALAVKLLAPGGELVAIVPRSFCNGVYFRTFREFFLSHMVLKHLHVFDSRDRVFQENDVLQENIILYAIKDRCAGKVTITSGSDPFFQDLTLREASYEQVVKPTDPHKFITIATGDLDQMVVDRLSIFTSTLDELGISASTGPVVDFRAKDHLRHTSSDGTVPLIYPSHIRNSQIEWPATRGNKPNAIVDTGETRPFLMPNEWYVVTRRFSSKEERRRVVAALFIPLELKVDHVGFENHLNVFHRDGRGLQPELAKGLALYLNSTLIDLYFRQFSGHTQVNATDLRSLRYPDLATLLRFGNWVDGQVPSQDMIDRYLEEDIRAMADTYQTNNPVDVQRKVQEARSILGALGMPKAQRNDRSAFTLLALLALRPEDPWSRASNPLMGITPIMDFVRDHYGRAYAPDTRETFRRFTMHQFVQAGIAVANPDSPLRAINSPKWVYQIAPHILDLLRMYGGVTWQSQLEHDLAFLRHTREVPRCHPLLS